MPLVGNSSRFHRNVNRSYYNYSIDEKNFSRQIIRYWANFIKTGFDRIFQLMEFIECSFTSRNPNKDPLSIDPPLTVEWKAYSSNEHNYLFFQLNHIRNEVNYFDSMYQFWLECFRIEDTGLCPHSYIASNRSFLSIALHILTCLLIVIVFFFILFCIWRNSQQKKRERLLSPRSPGPLLTYPHRVSA